MTIARLGLKVKVIG